MTNSRRVRRNVIKALHDNLTSGAIHIGNVGEMVAGLLLLFSFDGVLRGQRSLRPIKLSDFIASLLPDVLLKEVVSRMEEGGNCPPAGYGGCDLVAPVFLPRANKMSYISFQVKKGQDDRMGAGLRLEAFHTLKLAESLLPPQTANFGLMMCFRQHQGQLEYNVAPQEIPRTAGNFQRYLGYVEESPVMHS